MELINKTVTGSFNLKKIQCDPFKSTKIVLGIIFGVGYSVCNYLGLLKSIFVALFCYPSNCMECRFISTTCCCCYCKLVRK
jgi:hypothetical protein